MRMDLRYLPDQETYRRMTTAELRKAFVIDSLFERGEISAVYCDADRAIVGGAVPTRKALRLEATKKEMAADFFNERREVGIANLGGDGSVIVDGAEHPVRRREMIYVGRGARKVEMKSARPRDPAMFYFVSFPAHAPYPTALCLYDSTEKATVGSPGGANRRTINKYIHAGGAKSCQLVMGLTELEIGSVWNTMPPHTHQRRMEVYLYFDLEPDAAVIHLMGTPKETRSLILRNAQAVISPSWSVHCGAATSRYSFIWAMGGENQEFSDMDQVRMETLL
jgi:4-deoxy-L-threo-5-hexosulose-uronate ketol-isomerase